MIRTLIFSLTISIPFYITPYLFADEAEKEVFCYQYADTHTRTEAYSSASTELPEEKEVFQPGMIYESTPFSQGSNTYIKAGIVGLSGDTTYRIGGKYVTPSGSGTFHFPISELEFPLDIWMLSVEESKEFAKKWKVSVGAKKNYTSNAGKMKDSDWLTSTNPSQLDVYSQSDAYLVH